MSISGLFEKLPYALDDFPDKPGQAEVADSYDYVVAVSSR